MIKKKHIPSPLPHGFQWSIWIRRLKIQFIIKQQKQYEMFPSEIQLNYGIFIFTSEVVSSVPFK